MADHILRAVRTMAVALGVALLPGCSSVIDQIPNSLGGLPEGVPQRPAVQPAYPAVHDMPPPRQDAALTEAERKRLQEELVRTRDRYAPAAAENAGSTAAGGARNP